MGLDPKDARAEAEERFAKARPASTENAQTIIQSEQDERRKKTKKLKAERLAKEVREGFTDLDRKKPAKRK